MMTLLLSVVAFGQKKVKDKVVDAGCGMCIYDQKSEKGCAPAVKIDGKVYFVEGADKKALGDAHAHDGYCNREKKAKVSGEIRNGKFYAKEFAFVPSKK